MIKKTATTNGLIRTASSIDYNSDYTVLGAYMPTTSASNQVIFSINGATGATPNNRDTYGISGGGAWFIWVESSGGGALVDVSAGTPSAGTQYYWAARRTGNLVELLIGTTPDGMSVMTSGTGSIAGRSQASVCYIFGDTATTCTRTASGDYTGTRMYQSSLSDADIQAECASIVPIVTSGLWADYPMVLPADIADRSGNSRDLTMVGTLTTGQAPSTHLQNLYLPSSGDFTTFTPAIDGEWDDSEDMDRIVGTLVRGSTAFTDKTGDEASTTNNYDICVRQYVYGPMTKAGTWDGAILGIIRCSESNTAANSQSQMIVRIMATDGTVRGTLVSAQTGTSNEWNTTLRSIAFPKGASVSTGVAVSGSVTFSVGDYLIVELGSRNVNTSSTNRISTMNFGENSSTHLDFSEADTGADCPFIMVSYPLSLAFGAVEGEASVNTWHFRRTIQMAHFG